MDRMNDTPRWNNLPSVPSRPGWDHFSADPRTNPTLRASDADRGVAASIVAEGYASGRLDADEHAERLDRALTAKQLGDLVPLIEDLPVAIAGPAPAPAAPTYQPRSGFGRLVAMLPSWWIGLAVMFNAIWLMTCLTTGRLLYYWPMWPMFGTAIPVVVAMLSGANHANQGAGPGVARYRRRVERTARRQLPSRDDLR